MAVLFLLVNSMVVSQGLFLGNATSLGRWHKVRTDLIGRVEILKLAVDCWVIGEWTRLMVPVISDSLVPFRDAQLW